MQVLLNKHSWFVQPDDSIYTRAVLKCRPKLPALVYLSFHFRLKKQEILEPWILTRTESVVIKPHLTAVVTYFVLEKDLF